MPNSTVRGWTQPFLFQGVLSEDVIHSVVDSMVRNPDARLGVAHLKQKDTETYGHDLQVAVYLVAFGRHVCLPTKHLEHLCVLGLLLDLGKRQPLPIRPDEPGSVALIESVHRDGNITVSGRFVPGTNRSLDTRSSVIALRTSLVGGPRTGYARLVMHCICH